MCQLPIHKSYFMWPPNLYPKTYIAPPNPRPKKTTWILGTYGFNKTYRFTSLGYRYLSTLRIFSQNQPKIANWGHIKGCPPTTLPYKNSALGLHRAPRPKSKSVVQTPVTPTSNPPSAPTSSQVPRTYAQEWKRIDFCCTSPFFAGWRARAPPYYNNKKLNSIKSPYGDRTPDLQRANLSS